MVHTQPVHEPRTWAGFLFLAVVLDVWSRKIVGWAMSTTLHTDVVLDALNMAVTQRQPRDVIHHSDHGCQYTSFRLGADLSRRWKSDRFREVGFGSAVRIELERVAFAA